jgi:hypothetical protein
VIRRTWLHQLFAKRALGDEASFTTFWIDKIYKSQGAGFEPFGAPRPVKFPKSSPARPAAEVETLRSLGRSRSRAVVGCAQSRVYESRQVFAAAARPSPRSLLPRPISTVYVGAMLD